MTIRLATPADIPRVMQLVRRSVPAMRAAGNLQWDDDYPNTAVFERDVDRGYLWLAEINDGVGSVLAGITVITPEQTPEYAQVGWDLDEPSLVTHRLLVDPERRGQGLARVLMQQAETLAAKRGISVLRIDTSAENAATQQLFPKLGYTFSGEITISYRPGLRVLCYEKRLSVIG